MNIAALTPKVASITSQKVASLCAKLVEGGSPVYLNVEAVENADINDCFFIVRDVINEKGGSIQYGWQLWETLPGRMIEAEFHAVWVDIEGNYHDVSPKAIAIDRILFLPDPKRTYQGRQVDNVRIALEDSDAIIKRFIENAEKYYEATNRGELADQHGEIVGTPEIIALMKERDEIGLEIMSGATAPRKSSKVGRNDPCPCGSGKKYKKCHGRE